MPTLPLDLSERSDTEIARALVALGYDRVRNVIGLVAAMSEQGVRIALIGVLSDSPRVLGDAVEHAIQGFIARGLAHITKNE